MRAPLLCRWLARRYVGQHRDPDFVIGSKDDPYMRRWFVIPRNRYFNIYLHQIIKSDDDRALHDHPWWSISLCLKGRMHEITPMIQHFKHSPPSIAKIEEGDVKVRSGTYAHRLVIYSGECWTLFITGPIYRQWGFYCPQGWRPWKKYVSLTNPGLPGPGCD